MAKKKKSSEWSKDIVGFKRLSFWYGDFKSRTELEAYFDSFCKQVGLPDTRQLRHDSNLVFGRNATLEELIAEVSGSSYFGPRLREELKKQRVSHFNSAVLLEFWRPPDLEKVYNTRKLKHLGFVRVLWGSKSIAEKSGGSVRQHEGRHSVWLCRFSGLRSLKSFFRYPKPENMHASKFYQLTQPGYHFDEDLTSLCFHADYGEYPIMDILRSAPKHAQHTAKQMREIVKLCESQGHNTATAIFVASGYNHDHALAHGSALGRSEISECLYLGSFKVDKTKKPPKRHRK